MIKHFLKKYKYLLNVPIECAKRNVWLHGEEPRRRDIMLV